MTLHSWHSIVSALFQTSELMENEKDDDNETTVSGVSLAWDTIIGQSTAKVPHGVA